MRPKKIGNLVKIKMIQKKNVPPKKRVSAVHFSLTVIYCGTTSLGRIINFLYIIFYVQTAICLL